MSQKRGGTYDDSDPREIRKAVEEAKVRYWLSRFYDVAFQCEVSLTIAMALEDNPQEE